MKGRKFCNFCTSKKLRIHSEMKTVKSRVLFEKSPGIAQLQFQSSHNAPKSFSMMQQVLFRLVNIPGVWTLFCRKKI